MLTVRTSENTVITSFRLISERQDFSSVRTGENTVRARARIQLSFRNILNFGTIRLREKEKIMSLRRSPKKASLLNRLAT